MGCLLVYWLFGVVMGWWVLLLVLVGVVGFVGNCLLCLCDLLLVVGVGLVLYEC